MFSIIQKQRKSRHAGKGRQPEARWLLPCVLLLSVVGRGQAPVELYPVGPLQSASSIVPVFGSQYPRSVDVDGDGQDDLLKASPWEINVALGLGNHQFQPWITTVAQPQACWSNRPPFCIEDFDGDGNVDVVMGITTPSLGCGNLGAVHFYAGQGNGSFASPVVIPNLPTQLMQSAGTSIYAVRIIPGGHPELLISTLNGLQFSTSVEVMEWQSTTFVSIGLSTFSFNSDQIGVIGPGDFNGDGVSDLVGWFANNTDIGKTYYLLQGSSTSPHFSLASTVVPTSLNEVSSSAWNWVRDVNEDGYDDLLISIGTSIYSSIPLGAYIAVGWGSPTAPLASWTLSFLTEPCPTFGPLGGYGFFGDFDQDSHLDALVGVMEGNTNCNFAFGFGLVFYRGDGNGGFYRGISSGSLGFGIAVPNQVLDSDQDGDLDFWSIPDGVGSFWSPNETLAGPGLATPSLPLPRTTIGLPRPGNTGFCLGVEGASPLSPCVLLVSTAPGPTPPPLPGLLISLDPAAMVLPTGSLGWLTTDLTGSASLPVPLPPDPALAGIVVYMQALVFPLSPPGLALSGRRRIVLW